MSKPTNPLLIAVRAAFPKIDCVRAYTTAYKAGGFRVKLYGCRTTRVEGLRAKLASAGFTDISVVGTHLRCPSVVILATKPA